VNPMPPSRFHRRGPQRLRNPHPRAPRPSPSLQAPPNPLHLPGKLSPSVAGTHRLSSTALPVDSSQAYQTPQNSSYTLAGRTQTNMKSCRVVKRASCLKDLRHVSLGRMTRR
jgi:hypothetical protein